MDVPRNQSRRLLLFSALAALITIGILTSQRKNDRTALISSKALAEQNPFLTEPKQKTDYATPSPLNFSIGKMPLLTPQSPLALRPFSAQRELQINALRDEGDTVKFFGYTIIKVGPENRDDNPDLIWLEANWKSDANHFLSKSLGLSDNEIKTYSKIRLTAFSEFDNKTSALMQMAQQAFGRDIAIALDGDLETMNNAAWNHYTESMRRLFGPARFQEFEDFRKRYSPIAARQVGFVPSFIR